MRRHSLAVALTFVVSLVVTTGSAQAVVVDMNPAAQGQATVTYPTDIGSYFGVAMVPGTRSNLAATGIPTVTTSGPACYDPSITPVTADIFLPATGLCYHQGGNILHKNETFALVWDPNPHRDWTAGYVEQFLRDVADGSASNSAHPNPSGNMSSPFALTPQYTDASGQRALYDSLYGGGYDDGRSYPSAGCTPSGTNPFFLSADFINASPNDVCLTDAQIK
jgi:hypothetical protein